MRLLLELVALLVVYTAANFFPLSVVVDFLIEYFGWIFV